MSAIEKPSVAESAILAGEVRGGESRRLLARLTPREKKSWISSSAVATTARLPKRSASARTVEVHKARMLSKLEVDGVATPVRLSLLGAT